MYTMCFATNTVEIVLPCADHVKSLSKLLNELLCLGGRDARHKGQSNGSLQVLTVAK